MLKVGIWKTGGVGVNVAVTVGVGRAAEFGILIKNGDTLENAGQIYVAAFDKTGTITEGKPEVDDIITYGISDKELITLAASVESVMSEVKDCLSDDKYKEFRDEGLQCSVDGVDAWANKVKAFCFETGVKKKAQKGTMWSFANPVQVESKINSIW